MTSTQVLYCEYCDIFEETYLEEHLRTAASGKTKTNKKKNSHSDRKFKNNVFQNSENPSFDEQLSENEPFILSKEKLMTSQSQLLLCKVKFYTKCACKNRKLQNIRYFRYWFGYRLTKNFQKKFKAT